MELNKDQILEYQQNRDPYLMIDYVTDVEPGHYSKGFKQLTEKDWFSKFIGLQIQICQECFR